MGNRPILIDAAQRIAIYELIYGSCIALDEKNFAGYLALCDESYNYKITAYSPEIRKEMTWLEHDKKGMELLFNNLPKHNSDHSPLTRHATVYMVKLNPDGKTADVTSALQVFKTELDGGSTALYAVGKLHDKVLLADGMPMLLERRVHLDTRQLGIGYHIPF